MHFQAPPHAEAKLVSCARGAIHDVVVDLRPGSPTWRRWAGVRLDADDGRLLYVPPGTAHGFLTLADDSTVLYQMSVAYVPEAARGVRWDDPLLAIEWPEPPLLVSARDRAFPLLV
jgi:dTDP-4-dehydrorhamnose 3,5-epimerase